MITHSKRYALILSAYLGAAGLASASNVITFQVDMSVQIAAATFDPTTDHVYARGSFNGFPNPGGLLLTNNPGGGNPALYTGTTNNTMDANGAQMSWKFATDATNFATVNGYETTLNGNRNRLWVLGTNTTVVLPYTFFSDAAPQEPSSATFQVNMAMPIFLGTFDTNTMMVEVQGNFQGWASGYTLTNDPAIRTTNSALLVTSNVYTGTFPLVGSPGQLNYFKYVISNNGTLNYEQPNGINGDVGASGNRFVLIDTNQPVQIVPVVNFNDVPLSQIVTNDVMFQVNMSVMSRLEILNPGNGSVVSLQGGFNGWNSTGYSLTNDPAAANTNIYSIVVPKMVAGVNSVVTQFKFLCSPSGNSSYEPGNAFLTYTLNGATVNSGGGNRQYLMPNKNNSLVVLPVVYYGDVNVGDSLPGPTLVTFSVNMSNAVAVGGTAFNPASDRVYINGVNYPIPTTTDTVNRGPAAVPYGGDDTNTAILPFLMTNNPPGSRIYSLEVLVPAGYPVRTGNYRYSINGINNETATGNHRGYIRNLGSYQMPLDTWGSMVSDPTSFGDLAIKPKSGGNVPVTWKGRPGVNLQENTNLSSGSGWRDVPNTDGTSATNYPAGASSEFFRLTKPFYFPNY